ncbi:MAG: AGE family epimerase/isomerase [Verrucomicrobiae bacterium]|nr:AGE family epimerase/isomerase [Verrucomicrobiae bacterium]
MADERRAPGRPLKTPDDPSTDLADILLVWLNGYRDTNRNYLEAAAREFRFLQKHFRDPVHGGYFWETDLAGKVTDDRKILYGHAFAIYAMVEYHRASGEPAPLRAAIELYRLIQRHAHDDAHGGWVEHFARDWQPILDTTSMSKSRVPGARALTRTSTSWKRLPSLPN